MDILNRFNKQSEDESSEINDTIEKYLTFIIEKQFYAFHVNDVVEIIEMQEITPVPEFPDYAKGIINLRGLLIPIIDVRLRFCKMEMDYNERTCIIILNLKNTEVGFIVDTVDEVIDIDKSDISGVPNISGPISRRFIEGVGKLPKKIVMLLNAQKMLSDEEIYGLESNMDMDMDAEQLIQL